MSKSRGNVVNPDDVVTQYGADSLRLYEMFMGPLEAVKPWNMDGVGGVRSFLERAWRSIVDVDAEELALNPAVKDLPLDEEENRLLNKTVKAVTEDVRGMSFNTAIARMMEFVNFFSRRETRPLSAMRAFTLLLSPFAPHIGEELWKALGGEKSLAYEPWPQWDEAALHEATIVIPVLICGKLRAKIEVPSDADSATVEAAALAQPKIAASLEGKTIVKTIVVPGKTINFVAK
ncbi:MAG: class I tRNA ligase family protein [Thermoguttaceae bacterium]|nr:class I tRNA ligase family protein [Thermoguttaceae bacterium]